jgi:1-acyl-sn-glycerol-3-phosphate acyltransferase
MFADSIDELAFAALQQRRKSLAVTQQPSFFLTLRLYYRFARLVLHLMSGVLIMLLSGLVFVQHLPWQQPLMRWWHRRFCHLLNLDIRVQGRPAQGHALWVSNHVSWLDIPVLGANFPVYFLSKAEVASWPVIGWMARMAGTLFIKRGAGDADQVIKQLAGHLEQGRNVLFFPEGTTTDGHRLKRFFHKLFNAATITQTPIQPVLICYRDENDGLHPHAPFVGDDEFLSHALEILKGDRITVDIVVFPLQPVGDHDSRALAHEVERIMAAALPRLHQRDLKDV